jgi:hypothetical protein
MRIPLEKVLVTLGLLIAAPLAAGDYVEALQLPRGIVFPTAGRVTSESGRTATFTVVLDADPGTLMGFDMVSSDPGEGTVSPDRVTFTPADWDVPQTVTVTGVDDEDLDGSVPYTIRFFPFAVLLKAGLVLEAPPEVQVVNLDNEPGADGDGDGIVDAEDDCPATANADQADLDADGAGDACDVDDDADGVADEVELAAPNNGDGNSDGLPDALQPRVASLRTSTDKTFVTVTATDCERLAGVFTTGEAAVANDPAWEYPYGLVRFQLSGCSSASPVVALKFHGVQAASGTVYRQYGGGWSAASAVLEAVPGSLLATLMLSGDESLGGPARTPLAECPAAPVSPLPLFAGRSGRVAATGAPDLDGPWIVAQHHATLVAEDEASMTVEYVVTLTNLGPASQYDNPGPEMVTFLPPCSTVLEATATQGTATVFPGSAVTWDGTLTGSTAGAAAAEVTVQAKVKVPKTIPIREFGPGAHREETAAPPFVTWWQSMILSDAHLTGVNDTVTLSDDPDQPGEVDPTKIRVAAAAAVEIPTVSELGLLLLTLLMGGLAMRRLRGREPVG